MDAAQLSKESGPSSLSRRSTRSALYRRGQLSRDSDTCVYQVPPRANIMISLDRTASRSVLQQSVDWLGEYLGSEK